LNLVCHGITDSGAAESRSSEQSAPLPSLNLIAQELNE